MTTIITLTTVTINYIIFNPTVDLDDELRVYTVSLNEIDLYGEGKTVEAAVGDLIDSILKFLVIYIEKFDLFAKAESEIISFHPQVPASETSW